jgi:hypothetical protein
VKEEYNKAASLIKHLENQVEAFEFLKPVDYKALGLDDYPAIIKKPMDLSTVKKNLKNNKYALMSDLLSDLNLIWENCRTYNMQDSVRYM